MARNCERCVIGNFDCGNITSRFCNMKLAFRRVTACMDRCKPSCMEAHKAPTSAMTGSANSGSKTDFNSVSVAVVKMSTWDMLYKAARASDSPASRSFHANVTGLLTCGCVMPKTAALDSTLAVSHANTGSCVAKRGLNIALASLKENMKSFFTSFLESSAADGVVNP